MMMMMMVMMKVTDRVAGSSVNRTDSPGTAPCCAHTGVNVMTDAHRRCYTKDDSPEKQTLILPLILRFWMVQLRSFLSCSSAVAKKKNKSDEG